MGGQKWHGMWRTLCWLNIGQPVAYWAGEMVEMEKFYACNYTHRLHKEKKHLVSFSGELNVFERILKLNVFENWFASLIDGFMTCSLPKKIISDLTDPLHHI